MAKKEELDEESLAFIQWCIEVDHIEEQVDWFTDQYCADLTPEEAAKEALA
jgi:hypothetical protein